MKYVLYLLILPMVIFSQENTNENKFRQLAQELPDPNTYRSASGMPGPEYWQQKADYDIQVRIDDKIQRLYGEETITYHNNSPDNLNYLWLQLDQNVRAKDSDSHHISQNSLDDRESTRSIKRLTPDFDGGFKIEHVKDGNNNDLKYVINKTMMRVDLNQPLKAGESYIFKIKWWYNINNTGEIGGRSGYEHFEEDGNNVYVIAQFFPRMCVYDDVNGWQNKQFLGRGEFALVFGDYKVAITVPEDHLVASTGVLKNADKVLTKSQRSNLEKATKGGLHPIIISNSEEAEMRINNPSYAEKTWVYQAENVRDFAFASSRRFIWDAIGVKMTDGRTVMAQSMWTKEGHCLWSKYSTKAVAHTLKWYSHYTFDYPYPVAWSIDGSMGMEYPMICFNFGRCEEDGTYSERMKYGHIGVIIHEVGHNWFPMIINSDERQWTWMDEGLNSFLQFITEQHWERDYPSRRGPAHKIVDYMKGDKTKISPIMTNSESIFQFGNNAYGKPATALNILRETIMGRELFDFAFKEYANRWKFKHPTPADFFRTMEDASAVDLDWFWRGWFFTNNHVDLGMQDVVHLNPDDKNPTQSSLIAKASRDQEPLDISTIRNREEIKQTLNEIDTSINDFYTHYDPLDTDIIAQEKYDKYLEGLSAEEKNILTDSSHYYQIKFKNKGGLPMPIIVEFTYADGSNDVRRIPAEIWRFDDEEITKVFVTEKEAVKITLDPYLETADVDRSDNNYPPVLEKDRFEIFKSSGSRRGGESSENPMQKARKIQEREAELNRP